MHRLAWIHFGFALGACCSQAVTSEGPVASAQTKASVMTMSNSSATSERHLLVAVADPRVGVMGRTDSSNAGTLRIGYPGVTMRLSFEGAWLGWKAWCSTANCRVSVVVDGSEPRVLRLEDDSTGTMLAEQLSPGPHTVDIVHRTETWQGIVNVGGFILPAGAKLHPASPWPERRILFVGDSVTCGEGVDRAPQNTGDAAAGADAYHSYGMRLARALRAQCQLVCYGGRGLIRDWQGKQDVANAPSFFELALASHETPVPWDHEKYRPDLVFVSLGTNDFNLDLGPFPERGRFVGTYVDFVVAIRAKYPAAKIVLTEGAIVKDGIDPASAQKTVLRQYINETIERVNDPDVVYLPSMHYPGDATNAHPTGEQHAAMARDFEAPLAKLLAWPLRAQGPAR